MNQKKKVILLSIISVFIVIILTITITMAFMKPIEESSNLTSISLDSCANITLTSTSSINLNNTYAMSKNRALETEPYTFTVTTSCDNLVGFNLYLSTISTNTITADNIHYILTYKDSTDILAEGILSEATTITDFTDSELVELSTGLGTSADTIYQLYNHSLALKSSTEYDLYLYIDEDSTIADSSGMLFTGGISVKSYEREIIDTSKTDAEITINFEKRSTDFHLYRVAEIKENGTFTLVDPFDDYSIEVNSLDEEGLSSLANTLSSYVSADDLVSTAEGTTDENGTYTFTNLETGMYLLVGETVTETGTTGDCYYTPTPMMIIVPKYDEDTEEYIYDVSVDVAYETSCVEEY